MAQYAILFDLDGVLLDTEGLYTEFWLEMDRLYPTGVNDFARIIKGSTLPRILDTYFPDAKVQEEIREYVRQYERNMEYRPFDGAIPLMAKLKAKDYGIAIVTSSNALKMDRIFKDLPEFAACVDTLITDKDVERSKPDPQGYLLAAKKLGAERYVVVEDSLAGIEAGRRAGAYVVGIATTNPHSAIEPLADVTIDDISELSCEMLDTYFSK